jgi:hypothetical protein
MSEAELLSRLADLARGSLAPFLKVDKDGDVSLNFGSAAAKANQHLIKTLRYRPGTGEKSIELHDPMRAMETIAKILRLFAEVEIRSLQINLFEEALTKAYGNDYNNSGR